jgi:hypothetical protein
MHPLWLVARVCLFLAPGAAVAVAWKKYLRRTEGGERRNVWSTLNFVILVLITIGYCYFIVAILLMLTPLRNSFYRWPIYRPGEYVALADLVIGLIGGVLALTGRGVARTQVGWSGILLSLMSFVLLLSMFD